MTGSNSRVYYVRPTQDAASNHLWDTFAFTTNNGATESYAGTVTLVPPSGALVGSDFLLDNAGWTTSGNKATTAPATFEPYSRGALLNHYIYGTDDKINVKGTGGSDAYLWYFEAPSMYMGNWGIAYGGFVKFTIGIFSGDMHNMNAPDVSSFLPFLFLFLFLSLHPKQFVTNPTFLNFSASLNPHPRPT